MSKTAWAQGLIFSRLAARQVAQLLAAHRVQRPEDHHLAVLAALQHRLQARAQRQRRLAGAGPAAHRDDADLRVEQQVQRDPLLGAAAVQAEGLAVAAHQPDPAVRGDPAERLAALRLQHQAGVHRQVRAPRAASTVSCAKSASTCSRGDDQLLHSGPAGGDRQLGPVLLGQQADRGRLDPQRQVLGDDGDVVPLGLQIAGDRQDARVVVTEPEARRGAPRGPSGSARPGACRRRRRSGSARRAGRT